MRLVCNVQIEVHVVLEAVYLSTFEGVYAARCDFDWRHHWRSNIKDVANIDFQSMIPVFFTPICYLVTSIAPTVRSHTPTTRQSHFPITIQ